MTHKKINHGHTYRIRLKGVPNRDWTDWLGDIAILPQENSNETLLVCQFADQPALRGFLDQLWNLNLTILSVERVENEIHPSALP